ncbi:MAG: glycosyltransferase [Blastocatellia bacterium]
MAREVKSLLVVSHVVHYLHDGVLSAYGPYAREIDIWADLFPEVVIASPCRHEPPPFDAIPFTRRNIRIAPQLETGGDDWRSKIGQVLLLPAHALRLSKALWQADAVHVRCPGNLGLMGAVLAPLFSSRLIAKYAGQWNGYANEPRTVRWQRAVLGSRWWRGPVTVYGEWPQQPPHVVPFFTSMMEAAQVKRAAEVAAHKTITTPLRVLFSGRLVAAKRVPAFLEGLHYARQNGVALEAVIVGDGPDRAMLEAQTQALGLQSHVRFTGALPFAEAMQWYEWAHCLVLPSQHSEGWPKVVAEAMCYGLLCLAVDHGQVPAMINGRGILLPHGSGEEIGAALMRIAAAPAQYTTTMRAAAAWAQQYSLEGLREALARLLNQQWNCPPPGTSVHPA